MAKAAAPDGKGKRKTTTNACQPRGVPTMLREWAPRNLLEYGCDRRMKELCERRVGALDGNAPSNAGTPCGLVPMLPAKLLIVGQSRSVLLAGTQSPARADRRGGATAAAEGERSRAEERGRSTSHSSPSAPAMHRIMQPIHLDVSSRTRHHPPGSAGGGVWVTPIPQMPLTEPLRRQHAGRLRFRSVYYWPRRRWEAQAAARRVRTRSLAH